MTTHLLERVGPSLGLCHSACGKINLTLRVLGKRGDGFHDLHSLVVGVDWCDTLSIRRTARPGITLECSDPALAGTDNLVVRACRLLAERYGITPALRIKLEKRIPVGGGMGGGSSDAAVAMELCNRLWNLGLHRTPLASIGSVIGSDIPLFFALPAGLMTGRGEVVHPIRIFWSGFALLVFVDSPVSTPAVYAALRSTEHSPPPQDLDAVMRAATARELEPCLGNDLEAAVFRVAPRVGEVARAIEDAGFGPVRVSGAGSTLFRLFDEAEAAHDVRRSVEQLGLGVRCGVAAAPVGGFG